MKSQQKVRKITTIDYRYSDPKNSDESDSFFDDLYSNYTIMRVSAKRMINSKATGRGNVNELLICNC